MSFSLIYLILQVFNHMVLIFHSFKDRCFSYLDLDMQVFRIWKTSGTAYLQVFLIWNKLWKIYGKSSRKSSDGVFFYIKWSPSLSL
ncbi:hypothetical protein Bca101_037997 [Brassica carinata]